MSTPAATAKQIAEAEGKLVSLLSEIRGTATFERVQLWIGKMAGGKKLTEYLKEPDRPDSEKLTVVRALVDILLEKNYARLPELTPMESANVATPARGQVPAAVASVRVIEPNDAPGEAEQPPAFTAAQMAAVRAMVRAEVRRELAQVLTTIAKVLSE